MERAAACSRNPGAVVRGGSEGDDGSGELDGGAGLAGSVVENVDELVAPAGEAEKTVARDGYRVNRPGMLGQRLRRHYRQLPEP